MRELTLNEVEQVDGALSAGETVATNLGIVAIGVGICVAGATAPIWFPLAMIAVSVATVATLD
jgi:hypothetical protein